MTWTSVSASAQVSPSVVSAGASVSDMVVSADCSVGVQMVSGKTYKGEYSATPHRAAQQFATKGLNMLDDFSVLEIQTHEAPNTYGTTFTIGD